MSRIVFKRIERKQFIEYMKATDNKRGYQIEDWKKCKDVISIEEFIYILNKNWERKLQMK